ncbi:MAG TPA: urease accessory UreF family protein [Verrucomicrobiae bacterium]|jgi:hypothetical protein|nr:urease accessory UreF family protein [Verrucomicrobiae bacterium]
MILNGKSARLTGQMPEFERSEAASPQEDFSALLRRIGSPDYFDFSDISVINSPATRFLEGYVTELLIPVELPAIAEACGHALRQEHRELVLQDKNLTLKLGANPMASASRRIGRFQLARLRPLRDERVVRRYAESVESGGAEGWHTIVYGISMALFSLPLRQGLLHYARETLETLGKNFGEASVVDSLMERVPPAVEAALVRG